MSDDDVVNITRPPKSNRHWKPGQSGNPKGKPLGTLSKVTRLRQQLEDCLPEILETLKQQALGGDLAAIKLLLERVLPPLRSSLPAVSLPVEDGTLTERGDAILAAMARGELSPDTGNAMLQALTAQTKLIESQELSQRITALEISLKERQP